MGVETGAISSVTDHHFGYLGPLQWGIRLRRRALEEPPLLRVAAIGSFATQPKSQLEGSLWAHRRARPRGESPVVGASLLEFRLGPKFGFVVIGDDVNCKA